MRRYNVLFIGIVLMLTLAGCKHPTLEKAIAEAIPFEVEEVLYKKKSDGITIVLYTTKAKEVDEIKDEVLGVAFFEGNDKDGWQNSGPNGWEHEASETYSIYQDNFTKYDDKGNVLKDIYVVFGEIRNKDINRIEIANQGSEEYIKVKMLEKDGKRYYIGVGNRPQIRALNSNGEVIPQK